MSLHFRISLIFLALLAGLLMAWGVVTATPVLHSVTDKQAISMITPPPLPDQPPVQSPDISFIDSPTASCILPRANTGVCLMTWSYMYADANPNYIITMTVGIDNKLRGRYNGFFQTSMYVPTEMLTFRVPCGAPGSGGDPNLGASHSYTLRARDSIGLGAANYGSVICPADEAHIYLPLLIR